MLILKVDYLVTLIFQMSYLLVPKIEICLKYFLDKNGQKQPLCIGRGQKAGRKAAAGRTGQ